MKEEKKEEKVRSHQMWSNLIKVSVIDDEKCS